VLIRLNNILNNYLARSLNKYRIGIESKEFSNLFRVRLKYLAFLKILLLFLMSFLILGHYFRLDIFL